MGHRWSQTRTGLDGCDRLRDMWTNTQTWLLKQHIVSQWCKYTSAIRTQRHMHRRKYKHTRTVPKSVSSFVYMCIYLACVCTHIYIHTRTLMIRMRTHIPTIFSSKYTHTHTLTSWVPPHCSPSAVWVRTLDPYVPSPWEEKFWVPVTPLLNWLSPSPSNRDVER